jgi:hypothetical protein
MPRTSKKVDMVEFACDAPDCGYVVERRGMSWQLPKGWWTFQGRFFHSLQHLADTLAHEIGQETKDVNAAMVEIHIDWGDEGPNERKKQPYDNRRTNSTWQRIKR